MRSRVCLLALAIVACGRPEALTRPPTPTTTLTPTTTPASTPTTRPTVPSTTTVPASSTSTLATLDGLAYQEVVSGLPFPVLLTAPLGDSRSFVATKDGRVWIIEGDRLSDEPFLDISALVVNSGEQGLLGLAFPPDYADTGLFYVHFSAIEDGATMLMRFSALHDADRTDPASGELLLRVEQPAANHNGGSLEFGPDGYLYLGLGDGGGAGDSFRSGQNPETLLAKILRLDVSGRSGYGIPPDNPWAEGGGVAEAWAWGLRNPWRFSFDPAAGLLYIGDVGQGAFEEIDVAEAGLGGLNYGWPITEGLHCYRPSVGCDPLGTTLPAVEIEHGDAGTCSVTGGLVYRGQAIPELLGHYFYSDYCGGWLRSFRYAGGEATASTDWTSGLGIPGRVTSLGRDSAGEVYVITTDAVYRVVPVR